MEQKSNAFLETQPIGRLMAKYAIPCVISLLVAALYNIVDQIFIANADYLGAYGNAANTVVFQLTVVALAIAVMIGDGCCAFVSISLGAGRREDAHKSIGSAVLLCVTVSVALMAAYLIFRDAILTLFGGRVNEETFAQAQEYFFWIALGIPFYMFGQALNPIIRSDGSPRFAMASTLAGAMVNIILDPVFIFVFRGSGGHCDEVFPDRHLHCCGAGGGLHSCGGLQHRRRAQRSGPGPVHPPAHRRGRCGGRGALIVELFPQQLIGIFGASNESVYYTEYGVKCFRIYLCMMVFATVNKATFIYLQSLGKIAPQRLVWGKP